VKFVLLHTERQCERLRCKHWHQSERQCEHLRCKHWRHIDRQCEHLCCEHWRHIGSASIYAANIGVGLIGNGSTSAASIGVNMRDWCGWLRRCKFWVVIPVRCGTWNFIQQRLSTSFSKQSVLSALPGFIFRTRTVLWSVRMTVGWERLGPHVGRQCENFGLLHPTALPWLAVTSLIRPISVHLVSRRWSSAVAFSTVGP